MARFYCPLDLHVGDQLDLPAGAARHVQVLRLQPGDTLALFDGQQAGTFSAQVLAMTRSAVRVAVRAYTPAPPVHERALHLAVCMPANERMDWLLEKATELGATRVQPLESERSVLRLSGERAQRKAAHWTAVMGAACEQCGATHWPKLHPVRTLADWLADWPSERLAGGSPEPAAASQPTAAVTLGVLSLAAPAPALARWVDTLDAQVGQPAPIALLLGPEGGLSAAEEAAALACGAQPISLGPRVLRSETAALAALAALRQIDLGRWPNPA